MASASRATARMSSADGLFAMRSAGSRCRSAAFAGSSEGKGLSVTAISVRDMATLRIQVGMPGLGPGIHSLGTQVRRILPASSFGRKNLRVDAVRRCLAGEKRQNVVDDDIRHLFADLDRRAAEMRGQHDVRHPAQHRVDLGLMLEYVEAGTGDPARPQGAYERGLVDDRTARGVAEESGLLHQLELARSGLVTRLRPQRLVQRDEVRFDQQLVEWNEGQAGLAFHALGLAPRCPVQHAHGEAVGAPRYRLADQPTATHQADRLPPDEGAEQMAR